MAHTPPSEILVTIQAVKQIQADLTKLAKVVEKLGERIVRLESKIEASRKTQRPGLG